MAHFRQGRAWLALTLACGPSSAAMAQSAAVSAPPPAGATAPSGTPGASAPQGEVSEIVVTAQRRSENLQNVPIAITALASDTLTKSGVSDFESLQIAVPGLAFAQQAGYSLPRIRGVGTGANGPGVENSVAVYVDGVYIASTPAGMLSFNNIAQVAVLKGPQGTLFGRNATGGVIQITTLDPGQITKLDASVGYANYATATANLYAATPLTSKLAVDLAAYYNHQKDGFAHNVVDGRDISQGHDFSVRSKIKWEPTDGTTVRLTGDYAESEGVRFFIRVVPGTIPVGGVNLGGGNWDTFLTTEPHQKIVQKGVSLQVDQKLGALTLVSISALRRGLLDENFDADAVPAPITDVTIRQKDRQFSQEIQLLSPKNGAFTWMIGGYYFNARGLDDPQQVLSRTAPYLAPPTTIRTTALQTTKSYAGFGQGTYAIDHSTNVTAGIRYTSDKRAANIQRAITLPNGVALPVAVGIGNATFNKVTFRLSLDHRFSTSLLGYVSFNRGFKSGLYDPLSVPLNLVQPEVLDAYEVGIKADLLDRRLRLNGAFFHYNYKNIQTSRISNGVALLLNGQSAKVDGIDLDATAVVTDRFTVTAGLSVLDDRFTTFPNAVISTPLATGGNAISSGDAKGNRLPMTPNWTANLTAAYVIPTDIGDFELSSTYLHNDGYYESAENRLRQRPFNIVNASLSWTSPSKTFRASLWGKNLTNAFYATQFTAQNLRDTLLAGDPRTYGVTVGVKF